MKTLSTFILVGLELFGIPPLLFVQMSLKLTEENYFSSQLLSVILMRLFLYHLTDLMYFALSLAKCGKRFTFNKIPLRNNS